MKMYVCKTSRPNFGDALNHWMWPQLLDGVFDQDDRQIFLGIGSILYDSFPPEALKIVVGAGYGGYTRPPVIDANWRIFFVRGKLSAKHLGIDAALGVGDAAILIRSLMPPPPAKKFKVSFMPHWESTLVGDWPAACAAAGVHFLDPCAEVTSVMHDIRASELVLTEAMHGAIVSDALRVPWVALRPIGPLHRMKWDDWGSALGLSLQPKTIAASTLSEYVSGRVNSWRVTNYLQTHPDNFLGKIAKGLFVERAAARLAELTQAQPSLSSDGAIQGAHEQMMVKLDQFRAEFGR